MNYPLYQTLRGPDLEQGDILESCPVFLPPTDLPPPEENMLFLDEELRDVIVITQSCDLVAGREKVSEVLLCAIWNRAQLRPPHYLAAAKGMEEAHLHPTSCALRPEDRSRSGPARARSPGAAGRWVLGEPLADWVPFLRPRFHWTAHTAFSRIHSGS